MTEPVVRPFVEADAPGLTRFLHEAYAGLAAMGLNFTATSQDEATTIYRAGLGHCLVAEQDGRFVATVTVSYPPSHVLQQLTPEGRVPHRAWLNQMAVDPTLRGTGMARRLWDLGREWAVAQGVTSFGVDTARPATHLVGLYARWGFAEVGTIHWPGKTYDSVVLTRPA